MSETAIPDLGPEIESLPEYTEGVRKGVSINWYRSPLPPGAMKELHKRSDVKGAFQTVGFLAIFACTVSLAMYSFGHWPWWVTIAAVFLNGTVGSFFINAVHELGHGTVFKTKWLNVFFCHVCAFFGWINHEMFQSSHIRHHRYTLHPPDDLEVVLPTGVNLQMYLYVTFFNWPYLKFTLLDTVRVAKGKFQGEWELTRYPEAEPELRVPPVRWARCLLIGHALIFIVSMIMGWWILPVLVSLPNFYGGWLFFVCNNTQHIGLQDKVPDFRLCCRTFTLNPFVRFLYWQMNFHIEHHMYAAVPCYNLKRLHGMIKDDLAPCPRGIIATWKEILAILEKQKVDPTYQYIAPLPTPSLRRKAA